MLVPKRGESAELSTPFLTAFSGVFGVLGSAGSWVRSGSKERSRAHPATEVRPEFVVGAETFSRRWRTGEDELEALEPPFI